MNVLLIAVGCVLMALALVTTLPPAIVFVIAQRQVIGGMAQGAVKG